MATLAEVEKLAFALSETDRAILAAKLLRSLPPVLLDDDEGISEALQRDAELEINPGIGRTHDEVMPAARRAIGRD